MYQRDIPTDITDAMTFYSTVRGQCPVMCGTCDADGSTGKYYVPTPEARLIAGSSKHLNIYIIDCSDKIIFLLSTQIFFLVPQVILL